MSYAAALGGREASETVQEMELSAIRRLDEATALFIAGKYHTAIYLAGLAAEMYLKTACFFVDGAHPGHPVQTLLGSLQLNRYADPWKRYYEFGHGLWFWSQELIERRRRLGLEPVPEGYLEVMTSLCLDWFVGMRYHPGSATDDDADSFIIKVEWLASNHAELRR